MQVILRTQSERFLMNLYHLLMQLAGLPFMYGNATSALDH